jgi:hypothetical protein
MSKTLRAMFAAACVAALGFGASEAMAGPAPARRDDICEDKCWNTYRVCQQYNLGDCERKINTCLDNCAL